MRAFVLKTAAFLMIQCALFAVVLWRYDVSAESNYLAATLDKHRRLQAESAPRIIIVGGSNAAFGFESDRIEQVLGRSVVNMGLAAGLGVEFMLAEIGSELERNDVVVLSLEYDHFARGPDPAGGLELGFDAELLWQVLIFRPAGILNLGLAHYRKIVLERGLSLIGEIARRGLLTHTRAKTIEPSEVQAARGAFNAWGDLVAHRKQPPRAQPELVDALPLIADARGFPNLGVLKTIRTFVGDCSKRGVDVVFTFTPKSTGTMRRDGPLAERLEAALRAIPGLAVLDAPLEQTYAPEQFFDTANHLTAEGSSVRTDRVITSLRRFFANGTGTR